MEAFPHILSRHLLQLFGIVDAFNAPEVVDELLAVVGSDLLVGRVARPEIEAALDEAVLAAAGEDAAEAIGVLHVVGVEEAAKNVLAPLKVWLGESSTQLKGGD